jgi:glycosyltransferase involved in cell wall biosynthesis
MKVSVVLPTYNRAHIIPEALQSILAQTWEDYEILLVDDASTDNTPDVVRGFSGPRLRYVRQEQNCGVAASRNTGIGLAQGELISFLDSDDLWKPDKLEREVVFLDRYPEVQAVFSDLEKIDAGHLIPSFVRTTVQFAGFLSGRSYPDGLAIPRRAMYMILLQEVPMKPSGTTFRREALEDTGAFDPSMVPSEDWDLFLRFSRRCSFGYIDRPLAVLRISADSIHVVHREHDQRCRFERQRREIQLLKDDPEALRAARHGLDIISRDLTWHYLNCDQWTKASLAALRGFAQTFSLELLFRAGAACLPHGLRHRFRSLLGSYRPPTSK